MPPNGVDDRQLGEQKVEVVPSSQRFLSARPPKSGASDFTGASVVPLSAPLVGGKCGHRHAVRKRKGCSLHFGQAGRPMLVLCE